MVAREKKCVFPEWLVSACWLLGHKVCHKEGAAPENLHKTLLVTNRLLC